MNGFVIINGRITENLKISLNDRGFTLGDGLFETIPLYEGLPFLLDEHLERLQNGAKKLWFSLPFEATMVADGIVALAKRNKVKRGVVRLTLTRGCGARGYAVREYGDPTWIITVNPYLPDEKKQKDGITVAPIVDIRKDPKSPFANVKSTSALDKVYAMETAKRKNADEALLTSLDGYLASLASANLFWVMGSVLYTPSLDCGILAGVTRGAILKLALDNGVEVIEGKYNPDVLKEADEVFASNSLIEVQTVKKITGLFENAGNGAVTKKLSELYQKLTGA